MSALDCDRLAKLCGMFGSDHPGERANAAAAADRLVREAGLRWPDVLVQRLPSPPRERGLHGLRATIDYALEFADVLSDWEIGFVTSLQRQRTPISAKQTAILEQIVEKARRAEARAA
jgi:hypothetical protein